MTLIRHILNLPFAIVFFFISLIALMVNLFIPSKKFIKIQRQAQENEILDRLRTIGELVEDGDKVLDVGKRAVNLCVTGLISRDLVWRLSHRANVLVNNVLNPVRDDLTLR